MRNERALLTLAAVLALGLAGCEEGAETGVEDEQAGLEMEEEVEQPVETATRQVAGTGEEAEALTVEESARVGEYLADDAGRAVYILEADAQGQTRCVDACAEKWPPVLAENGAPELQDPALQENLIGTIERPDGQTQVTYNGKPLYYYVEDTGPGDIAGQDMQDQWGEWYLVNPQGEPLQQQRSAQAQL